MTQNSNTAQAVIDKEAAFRILEQRNNASIPRSLNKKPKAFDEFLRLHNDRKKNDHQRLGQRFCCMYIPAKWPDLYYAKFPEAKDMIIKWMNEHGVVDHLPEVDLQKRVGDLRAKFGKV